MLGKVVSLGLHGFIALVAMVAFLMSLIALKEERLLKYPQPQNYTQYQLARSTAVSDTEVDYSILRLGDILYVWVAEPAPGEYAIFAEFPHGLAIAIMHLDGEIVTIR